MSQWGKQRGFVCDDGSILRVVAHVASGTWQNITPEHLVDDLLVTHGSGLPQARDKKLAELRERYVGKSYAEWCKTSSL